MMGTISFTIGAFVGYVAGTLITLVWGKALNGAEPDPAEDCPIVPTEDIELFLNDLKNVTTVPSYLLPPNDGQPWADSDGYTGELFRILGETDAEVAGYLVNIGKRLPGMTDDDPDAWGVGQ